MNLDQAMLLAGVAIGIVAVALARRSDETPEAGPPRLRDLWPAFVVALVASLVFRRGLVFLVGPDDYTRLFLSFQWAREPYFATHDQVWLSGHFWTLGLAYLALRDLSLVVTVTSLAGVGLTILLAARLAWTVSGSRAGAVLAAILAGTQWQVLWASATPMSEVFFLPAVLGMLDAFVRGWHARADATRADRLFLQAAAWCAAGTLFRYEAWYAAALLGGFLGVRAARALSARDTRRVLAPLCGALLAGAFPLAWALTSRVRLGAWTAFVDNARAITFGGEERGPALDGFLKYARILVEDHRPWLALPLAGAAMALTKRGRAARPLIAAIGLLALVAMALSVHGGIGEFNRPRLTLFLLLPLLALAALPLGALWRLVGTRSRQAARAAVVAYVAFIVAGSVVKARSRYPHASGASADVIAIMSRLERERDHGRSPEEARIRARNADLFVFHQGRPNLYFMALYHSGHPDRVRPIDDPRHLDSVMAGAAAGDHVLVRKPGPGAPAARARLLLDLPEHELWELR